MDMAVQKTAEKLDMDKMMEAQKKIGTPGIPHKMLASRTGKWNVTSKHYMSPDKPPMESKGTSVRKTLFDGRYLKEEFTGDMMGTPFNGISIMAYNNQTKMYQSIWLDSMSTGIYSFEGSASPDGKTITLDGQMECPMRGQGTMRLTTRIKDNDTETFEMLMTFKDGSSERAEMTYTRA